MDMLTAEHPKAGKRVDNSKRVLCAFGLELKTNRGQGGKEW